MGPPLREALRRLCHEFGWSYAVFWRATGFGSGMHLIWEDGYYDRKPGVSRLKVENDFFSELGCQADDRIGVLVDKIMASQVHVVGDGLIGRAASLGKHQWIKQDTLDRYGSTSKDFTEIDCQIGAGMQTIVVVPVLPFGVIQLGSAQMVRENIAFINHVKSLILKQNCGSGALPSDTTQKALREKSQIYSSPGLLFGRQSADACTKIDNKLLVTTNGCSPELVKSPAPRSFTQSFSAVSSHLNKKMQPSASEVMPIKQIIKSTYPLGKLILQGTQDIFPKPDMAILSANIGFECQNDPSVLSSDLLSNSLKVLEEELMFTSAIGALESTNNVSASLEDTKSIPLNVKRESSNMQDELRNASSISGGIAEFSTLSAKLSASGAPPILHQRSHSLGNPGISEVCNKDQPFSINKVSHTESSVGVLKGNDDLIQASCVFSSASDVLVSCSDMLPGILQECELCYTNPVQRDQRCKNVDYEANGACPAEHRQCVQGLNEYKLLHKLKNDTSPLPLELTSSNDLFCMLGFDQKTYCSNGSLNDVLVPRNSTSACSLRTGIPKLPTDSDACPVFDSLKDQVSCSGLFYVDDSNQLLDAVISNINSGGKQGSDDSVSCKTSITNVHSSHYAGTPNHDELLLSKHSKDDFIGFPPVLAQTEPACSSYGKSTSSFEKGYTQKMGLHKSQISSWVENCQSVKYDCVSDSSSKKVAEVGKLNRKRPRPGESPRPRPKDRQMIQDRIKELREIVPNGAKCSIDALLEKTIKHMLFLQNVTKHADKLKIAGEPKISNEEGGLLLKDNFEGGATWAFEVGTQPMICPIIVEDLNPPRQMLVEMLCEEQGFFLEIADFIRRLGLTILKGVMEARKNKVWARFAVEANRDVTRMEIFLSLVQLLEPTAGSSMALPSVGNIKLPYTMFHQTSVPARVI